MAVGYLLSIILVILLGIFDLWIIALLILPMAIDGTGQLFGKWTSNNNRRFLTGLIGGIGIIYIFYTIGYQFFYLVNMLEEDYNKISEVQLCIVETVVNIFPNTQKFVSTVVSA